MATILSQIENSTINVTYPTVGDFNVNQMMKSSMVYEVFLLLSILIHLNQAINEKLEKFNGFNFKSRVVR